MRNDKIKGEYAWTMMEALMVGYASDGFELEAQFKDALKQGNDEFRVLSGPRECRRTERGLFNRAVHVSQHGRSFDYVETRQPAPPITLRHLWLKRD